MKHTIMRAIEFSQLAYSGPKAIQLCLQKGYPNHTIFDIKETDVQGFCIIDPIEKRNWVVLRGTDSYEDWMTNIDISFVDTVIGRVHRGFYLDAESVYQIAKDFRNTKYQTIYTGHSLGGATALQLFLRDVNDSSICIPIEAPRSCSKQVAKIFGQFRGSSVWPIVHNNDIVRRLPPRCMGYAHLTHTNIQYIDRDGKVRNNLPWYRKYYDSVLGKVKDIGTPGLDCIKDHDIDTIKQHWGTYIGGDVGKSI